MNKSVLIYPHLSRWDGEKTKERMAGGGSGTSRSTQGLVGTDPNHIYVTKTKSHYEEINLNKSSN